MVYVCIIVYIDQGEMIGYMSYKFYTSISYLNRSGRKNKFWISMFAKIKEKG